jgi:Tat protein translocase TatB subunit
MGSNLFGIGFGELIFLVILALIIFGPKRIPEVARTIGRFLQQVRQATGGIEEEVRQLMEGQGDPSTWLQGGSPSQAAHPPVRPTPFSPGRPAPGPHGAEPSALPAPAPRQEPGPAAEIAPPKPEHPQEQENPEGTPPSTSLSG